MSYPILQRTSDGWSILPSGANLRYADFVSGDNANGGTNFGDAKKDLSDGIGLLTNNSKDRLLLKENTTWTSGNLSSLANKSGQDGSNLMTIVTENWDTDGAVNGRAVLNTDADLVRMLGIAPGSTMKWIGLFGIEKTQPNYDGTSFFQGIDTAQEAHINSCILEDCYLHDMGYAIQCVHSPNSHNVAYNIIRRCSFSQNYADGIDTQSVFLEDESEWFIQESVIYRGGWHPLYKTRDFRQRGLYNQYNTKNMRGYGNAYLESASEIQYRGNAFLDDCLWEGGGYAVNMGYANTGNDNKNSINRVRGYSGSLTNSVIMDPRGNDSGARGCRVQIANVSPDHSFLCKNNLICRDNTGVSTEHNLSGGIRLYCLEDGTVTNPNVQNNGMHNVLVEDNTVYDIYSRSLHFTLAFGTLSGRSVSNVKIKNNTLHCRGGNTNFTHIPTGDPRSNTPVLELDVAHDDPLVLGITFSGNTYSHAGYAQDEDGAFMVGGIRRSFDWWQSNVEPSATWIDPSTLTASFTDPTRSLGSYYTDVLGEISAGQENDSKSTGTITLVSVNAGDTVTFFGQTYTAVSGAKANNTEFDISVSDTASATDLAASITNDARHIHTATSNTNVVTIVPYEAGIEANSMTLAESTSGARITLSGSALSGGVDGNRQLMKKKMVANRRGNWDSRLLVPNINTWVMAGFNMTKVIPYQIPRIRI